MLKKIIPVVLLCLGSGAGVAAGMFLRPASEPTEQQAETEEKQAATAPEAPPADLEYVKMSNQFVVPVVKDRVVVSLVVMSLSVEVPLGQQDLVFRREPKLRDSFLRVLFDHANIGGFDGAFTEANNLAVLRTALRETGQRDLGPDIVRDVLITEIARQDY